MLKMVFNAVKGVLVPFFFFFFFFRDKEPTAVELLPCTSIKKKRCVFVVCKQGFVDFKWSYSKRNCSVLCHD